MASNDLNEEAFSKESTVITSSEKTQMVLEDQQMSKSQFKKLQKKALKQSYKRNPTSTDSSDHQNSSIKTKLFNVGSEMKPNKNEGVDEVKSKEEFCPAEHQSVSTQPETAKNISNQHLLSLQPAKNELELKEPVVQDVCILSKEPEMSKSQSKKLQKKALKQSYKTNQTSKGTCDLKNSPTITTLNTDASEMKSKENEGLDEVKSKSKVCTEENQSVSTQPEIATNISNQHLLSLQHAKNELELEEPVIEDMGSLSKEPEMSKSQVKKLQKKALKQSYKTNPKSKDTLDHENSSIKSKLITVESKMKPNREVCPEEHQYVSTQPETAPNISNQHLLPLHNAEFQTKMKEPVIQNLHSLSKEPEMSKSQSKKLQKQALKQSYKTNQKPKYTLDHENSSVKTKLYTVESEMKPNKNEGVDEVNFREEICLVAHQSVSTQPETATNISNQHLLALHNAKLQTKLKEPVIQDLRSLSEEPEMSKSQSKKNTLKESYKTKPASKDDSDHLNIKIKAKSAAVDSEKSKVVQNQTGPEKQCSNAVDSSSKLSIKAHLKLFGGNSNQISIDGIFEKMNCLHPNWKDESKTFVFPAVSDPKYEGPVGLAGINH